MTAVGIATGMKATKAVKLKSFCVILYGDHSRPLFRWSGKAVSAAAAEQHCFDTYQTVVKALCHTQSIMATLVELDLVPISSHVQSPGREEGWRISWLIPSLIKDYAGANLLKLSREELQKLASDGALTDPVCREAARALEKMRIGFWMTHVGQKGLREIGTCLLIERPGREIRHNFTNPALSEALRYLFLRTSLPFKGGTALPRYHPFAGPTCELVISSSAVERTIILTDPPKPPIRLISWLQRQGYAHAADRLQAVHR